MKKFFHCTLFESSPICKLLRSLLWRPGHQFHHRVEKKPCIFCMQHLYTATTLHYNFTTNIIETITTAQNTLKHPYLAILYFWNLNCTGNKIPNCFTCTKTVLYVAGGFWAVILTHPAQARCWAWCGLVEAGGCGWGLCLNRRYGIGPACDSLDHRARVCYLPRSLPYDELHHTISMHSLSVPPSTFWTCIALSQSRVPSFLSKNWCTSITN